MRNNKMIKRTAAFALATALVLGVSQIITVSGTAEAATEKSLLVSFVHRDNIGDTSGMDLDALSSATVYSGATGEEKSTVEVIRDTIKSEKKMKTFAIKVKKAYSKDYQTTVARADKEIDSDAQVGLKKSKIPHLKDYDTVYLCTPVWHGTLPQPVKMLLKSNDFSGKTVYVFGTNLGSGFGDIISQVRKLCPDATVVKAKTYSGDAANKSAERNVKKWLQNH